MKNVLLKVVAVGAMYVASLTAVQAQMPAGPNRPTTVPAGYLITPFGYFHPSCVVHLAQGDELRPAAKVIVHATGAPAPMPTCAYPHFRADGEKVVRDEQGASNPNISHSWIVSESVTTTGSYGGLHAYWNVPPAPAANNGQTLFFFPGLEDINDVVTIIQPVLGWNADYKDAWGIASWNCCKSGSTFEAPPQPVNSGDTILGYMFTTCGPDPNPCATWDIVTWDLQNGKYSEYLNTSSFGQTFNWAFGGVLEVYNVTQCSDYPTTPNGNTGGWNATSFYGLLLYTNELVQVTQPAWSLTDWANGLTPQCNYGGSSPNQVLLTY
jgi:hypothetical protein